MKKILPIALITILSLLSIQGFAHNSHDRKESLNGKWKFSLGDNMKFADPNYDDSTWERIDVPGSWERDGFRNYDGFAWYRREITMDLTTSETLYLHLGRIDDADEVYLNGKLVGSTGSFPPNYVGAHNRQRFYRIPKEYARKKGNVLAIRVYDDMGSGGLIGYRLGIYDHEEHVEDAINLAGTWKFSLGDEPAWAEVNFDDSQWANIYAPGNWDSQGYAHYDGIAWYRKEIIIPADAVQDNMMIILGKIDDMDEVFVNGVKVGGTGDFNFVYQGYGRQDEYDKKRNYVLKDGVLKPGKKNVIAVRVYDHHDHGGIYSGPLLVIPTNQYRSYQKLRSNEFDHVSDWVQWIESIFD